MMRLAEHSRVSIGLVSLVIFMIGQTHAQVDKDVCRTGCTGAAGQTFKYAIGTTYKYTYDGKIEVSLSSAEGQVTSTEVKADVFLTQLADCDQALRLQNVQVIGSDEKKIGSIPDIEKPIRINNNGGVLDDSICVVEGDNQNSINVKRAIASIFQASLKTGYETDVFGTCPTDSSSHKEGNFLVVTKSRNLNKCSYREHIQQDFFATAFNLNSEIKSSPFLSGEYSANLKIKNGVLDEATVTEDYLYDPFSAGKNTAKAQIISKLHLSGTSKDNTPAPVTKPRSIIFENPHHTNAPNNNAQTILTAVKTVAETVNVVVGKNTTREFISLLKIIRVSKKGDLLAAYKQVKNGVGVGNKDAAKRLFLDALLRSGNGDSIETVLELLKQGELSDSAAKLALLGLNFIRHATESSINAAVHLLDLPNLPREAYLGIGNIAGRYCHQHSCDNNAAVESLTNKFLTKIGTKPTKRNQENDIIFGLKGLANFHHLSDNALQKLSDIAENKEYSNRVRVAALEAYLADPCKDKLRTSAFNLLEDTQQDSEVRIKSYLVIAQCPNAKVGNAVKALLEKEPSIQVGGFITSHIRSIRASANPDKALAKQHLGFGLKKRFPIDPRKYSFNGEFSYAVDTLGLAASSEANIIYSQKSWMPRSLSLNLTAQVFGQHLNLLQIETRQENLDHLVEHYFGPKGVLRSSAFKDLYKNGRKGFESVSSYLEQKLGDVLRRSKRNLSKAEIDQISKQIQIKTNELNKDLALDVNLKAFGSEVLFLNLNQKTPEVIIDDMLNQLNDGLNRLSSFQETLCQNLLFLDAEFDYPTSLGFPLRLAVEGSATVQVQAEGAIDVRRLINSPESGQFNFKLIPSANVEVSGRLTLDALVVETGLKVVTTLYSSTGGDINVSWDKSTGFDVTYGLPVTDQTIISVDHKIVFVSRKPARREQNRPLTFPRYNSIIYPGGWTLYIGLLLRVEMYGPNLEGQQIPIPPFTLAGDAKFDIQLKSIGASKYRIRHNVKGNQTARTYADLILEIIDKNNQTAVALDLQVEYDPEQYVKAVFSSLHSALDKTASAEARLVNTNVEKSLLLRVTNDKNEYSGKVGVGISGTPELAIYKPILEYKTLAGEQPLPVKAEGQIVVEKNGQTLKYTFENVRISNDQMQLILAGNIGIEAGVFFSDLALSDGQHAYTLQGRIQLTQDLIKFNIQHENGLNKNVNFAVKAEFKKKNVFQHIHGRDLEAKITQKVKGDYEIEFEFLGLDNNLEIKSIRQVLPNEVSKISNTLEVNGKKFEVEGMIEHQIHSSNINVRVDLIVKIPFHAVPFNVASGFKLNGDELDAYKKITSGSETIIDIFIKTNKNGNVSSSVKVNIRNSFSINGKFHANNGVGNGDVLINLQNGKYQLKGETSFTVEPAKSYDITVTVYPFFLKDKNLKIFCSTQTQVSESSIDSKNKVDFLGYPLEVNAKGSRTGDDKAGEIDGEIEVTVPSDEYILITFECDRKEENDLHSGHAQASLEYRETKNSPGHKFIHKGSWEKTNIYKGVIQGKYAVSADYRNGENWNTEASLERTNHDGTSIQRFNIRFYGSLLSSLVNVDVVTYSNDRYYRYEFQVYDTHGTLTFQSAYFFEEVNERSANINVRFSRSHNNTARALSMDVDGFVIKPLNTSQPLEIKGSLYIYGNSGDIDNYENVLNHRVEGIVKLGVLNGEITGGFMDLKKNREFNVTSLYDLQEDKTSGSIAVNYGANKTVKADIILQRTSDHHFKLTVGVQTPVKGLKHTQLSVETNRSKDNKEVKSAVELSVDGKIYKSQTELALSDLVPSVDFKLTDPAGQLSQIFLKGNKVSSKQFSGELKLIYEKTFALYGAIDVDVKNLDNLTIKGQVDSANLNLNKIVFEAHNKGTSTESKIEILVKFANKDLISGNASYTAKEESGKFIVQGSGNFTVKDEPKSGNFKYILQKLEKERSGETGTEASFDAALGKQAIDFELKSTTKQFRFHNSYCQQKKECIYVEIDNKINSNDVRDFNHVLEVNLDLRKLGLSHELGLKAVTTREEWRIEHTVDAYFQNQENSKYKYRFYVEPLESELLLTTPKRTVALEAKFNPYKANEMSGEIVSYMDKKNHANKKVALNWVLGVDPTGTFFGQTKFAHPGFQRPLTASFKAINEGTYYNDLWNINGEIDVFANESQKIVVSCQSIDADLNYGNAKLELTIQSKGLDIDILSFIAFRDKNRQEVNYETRFNYRVGKSKYDNLLTTKWSPNEISGHLKVLNKDILKFLHKLQLSQPEQVIDSEFSSYDNTTIISKFEVINNYNTLSYSIGYKNNPNNKLVFNVGLIPSQLADVRLDYLKEGPKVNLVFASLKLDEANFLKSDHKVNFEAIKKVLEKFNERTTSFLAGLEALSKEWATEAKTEVHNIGEMAKKASPNLQPLKQYYTEELEKLKNEILSDKSFKELGEAARSVLGSLTTAVNEICQKFSQLSEEAAIVLENCYKQVTDIVNKDFIPQCKEIISIHIYDMKEIANISIDIALKFSAQVSQIFELYTPELKELITAFEELTRDLGKVLFVTHENIRKNIRAVIDITMELKTSPFIEGFKAQYKQLVNEGITCADVLVKNIKNIFFTIIDTDDMIWYSNKSSIVEDIKNLLDTIRHYVAKKLNDPLIDDSLATFEKLAKSIGNIVPTIITIVSAEAESSTILLLSYLKYLPRLVAVNLSSLAYWLDQDLTADVSKFLHSLVTNPENAVPLIPLFGLIINQGRDVFTFDGKHITVSGAYKYLLVGDAVNGNFTLAGTYNNGVLESITLADKTDSVTLNEGGRVKLNNDFKELPARKPEIAAYRNYEVITLLSSAGIKVECTPNLHVCTVFVSGFYHGQVKGLLGNGNHEPYDDLTMPNGNTVADEGEFVNGYKFNEN